MKEGIWPLSKRRLFLGELPVNLHIWQLRLHKRVFTCSSPEWLSIWHGVVIGLVIWCHGGPSSTIPHFHWLKLRSKVVKFFYLQQVVSLCVTLSEVLLFLFCNLLIFVYEEFVVLVLKKVTKFALITIHGNAFRLFFLHSGVYLNVTSPLFLHLNNKVWNIIRVTDKIKWFLK